MFYFLYALAKNLVVLWLRSILWPLLLLSRLRPAMLKIVVPSSPPGDRPGKIARWLGLRQMDLDTLLRLLTWARREPAIKGVVLLVPELATGRSTVTEIREALAGIVGVGKQVVVVLQEGGTTQELRLAPAGARIVLHPSMGIRLSGPSAVPFFIGDLLKNHGIRADLHAVGDYKTAPETFTRGGMSDENRAQLMEILGDLDDHLDAQIAEGRAVDVQQVKRWKQKAVFTAVEAVSEGLVDEASFDSEVIDGISSRMRVASPGDRLLGLRRRLMFVPFARPVLVGVIRVKGQILSRSGLATGSGQALSDKIAPLIERAGKDPALKALVIELDSRGGSAIASDTIYRKARQAAARKPLVVYMRDVAASGGYYIASASSAFSAVRLQRTGFSASSAWAQRGSPRAIPARGSCSRTVPSTRRRRRSSSGR
jgi:protease-4